MGEFLGIWADGVKAFWHAIFAPIIILMVACSLSEWANSNHVFLIGLILIAMLIACLVYTVIGIVHLFMANKKPLQDFCIAFFLFIGAIYIFDEKISKDDFVKKHQASVEYVDLAWVEKRFWREDSMGAVVLNIVEKNTEKDLKEEEIRHQQLVENLRKSKEIEKKYEERAKAREAKRKAQAAARKTTK